MDYRIERDTLGEMKVPTDKLWGAQTQRSYENFPIGTEKMPMDVIRAFAMLKKGAALANRRLNNLEPEKAEAIAKPLTKFWTENGTRTSPSSCGKRGAAPNRI